MALRIDDDNADNADNAAAEGPVTASDLRNMLPYATFFAIREVE